LVLLHKFKLFKTILTQTTYKYFVCKMKVQLWLCICSVWERKKRRQGTKRQVERL